MVSCANLAYKSHKFALAAVPALPNSSSQAAGGGALLALPLPALPRPTCDSRLPSCGRHQELDVICLCDDICQDTHEPTNIVPLNNLCLLQLKLRLQQVWFATQICVCLAHVSDVVCCVALSLLTLIRVFWRLQTIFLKRSQVTESHLSSCDKVIIPCVHTL